MEAAIFNSKLVQVLKTAIPMKLSVKEPSNVPQHPLENGANISDHKIINPVEIDVTLFLNGKEYKSLYQQLRQLFLSSELLTIQTRTSTYKNMTILELPHDETAEMVDAIVTQVRFKEVRFTVPATSGALPATSVFGLPDQDTINSGTQNTTVAPLLQQQKITDLLTVATH